MNTAQRYAGKGNNLPFPVQTVKIDHSNIILVDEHSPINPRIFEAQSRLLELEDRFAERGNYAPIQVAEDLLLHWLTTSAEQLTAEDDADQLHIVLMLLDTLDEAYSIDSLPTINRKGFRSEPARLHKKYTRRLSPDFLNLFSLSESEEARAGIMAMPDARLAPQINEGSTVVVVSLESHTYALATGLVVLACVNAPDQPFSGRIIENDGQSILLLPDNPAYCEQRVCFSTIRFLASIKHSLNQPLV